MWRECANGHPVHRSHWLPLAHHPPSFRNPSSQHLQSSDFLSGDLSTPGIASSSTFSFVSRREGFFLQGRLLAAEFGFGGVPLARLVIGIQYKIRAASLLNHVGTLFSPTNPSRLSYPPSCHALHNIVQFPKVLKAQSASRSEQEEFLRKVAQRSLASLSRSPSLIQDHIYNSSTYCGPLSLVPRSISSPLFLFQNSFVLMPNCLTMKARQLFSRPESSGSLTVRKHTPWIASPLQEIDNPLTERNSRPEADEPPRPNDVLAFNATQAGERGFQVPAFKHNQESTTVELFYDLFFVANLATFTANHEIVDVKSLKNYIGFFTLLWFTWLQTSLFDVRFASDSFFDRVCKAISFGVMTGFAITGAIYDTTNIEDNVKAFRAMSIILMISRLALITQYGVVLWYIRKYRNTFIPLLATMASLFVAAVIFLGTFFGFPVKDHEGESETDLTQPDTYIAWYVVVCVEAAAVIAISCVWRVVSFKRTHLVERIGLLTLIIMGEGVLGMTKSVSRILQNSRNTTGSDVGVIMSSVLLIVRSPYTQSDVSLMDAVLHLGFIF